MQTPITVMKKPIPIQAIEWTGDNLAAVQAFTGADKFRLLPDGDARARDGFTAQVFDHLHAEWIPLHTRDLVLRGVRGEMYPCEREVYDETYEVAA